jgi:hypothetical protein
VFSPNNILRLGLVTFGRTGDKGMTAVPWALEPGYRHLEISQNYTTETEVGQAVRGSQRRRYFGPQSGGESPAASHFSQEGRMGFKRSLYPPVQVDLPRPMFDAHPKTMSVEIQRAFIEALDKFQIFRPREEGEVVFMPPTGPSIGKTSSSPGSHGAPLQRRREAKALPGHRDPA